MNRRLFFIAFAAATASVVLTATSGAADPTFAYAPAAANVASLLAQDSQQAVTVVNAFPTALDATLEDTAVTDDDLATVGVQPEAAPTLADDPKNLVVDDDGVQCPKAQYTTINAAVLAASPGAHIKVCPGLYTESVLISQPLLLHGERKLGDAAKCKTPVADDPTREAILQYTTALNGGNPSVGFQVQASDVKIEGFKVEPGPAVIANPNGGVGFFAFNTTSGWNVRHNVFQNNTIGAYPNSNGVEKSEFEQNCIRNNNLGGPAGGNGVYSDQGLSNAEIEHNYFTGDVNAIVIGPSGLTPPTQDVKISHNESVNDGAIAVFLVTPASMTIDHNKVVNPGGSGVRTDGLTNSDIDHNDVSGGGFSGISLTSTTFSHVGHNRARNFVIDGVRLNNNSDNNTVDHNRADDNTEAGLHALGGSMNNTIQENHMRDNAPDCQDETIGTGTAGTANFWIKDNGETESPPGICRHGH